MIGNQNLTSGFCDRDHLGTVKLGISNLVCWLKMDTWPGSQFAIYEQVVGLVTWKRVQDRLIELRFYVPVQPDTISWLSTEGFNAHALWWAKESVGVFLIENTLMVDVKTWYRGMLVTWHRDGRFWIDYSRVVPCRTFYEWRTSVNRRQQLLPLFVSGRPTSHRTNRVSGQTLGLLWVMYVKRLSGVV